MVAGSGLRGVPVDVKKKKNERDLGRMGEERRWIKDKNRERRGKKGSVCVCVKEADSGISVKCGWRRGRTTVKWEGFPKWCRVIEKRGGKESVDKKS